MKTQDKELKKYKKQVDIALKVSIITAISSTVLYVYEMLIYFSGNKLLPSLARWILDA